MLSLRLLPLLLIAGFFDLTGRTQTPAVVPADTNKTCRVRSTSLSPGDVAYAHEEFDKAAGLYQQEIIAAGPEGERAHAALVRALLRAHKIDAAEAESKAWTESAPKDIWSGVALADLQWRKGLITEVSKTLQVTSHQDVCNAEVHFQMARYFQFNDLLEAAKAEIDQAHVLDPVDGEIDGFWLRYQPRALQLEAVTKRLASDPALPEKQRKTFEEEKGNLSENPAESCHLVTAVQNTSIPLRSLQDGPNSTVTWGLNVSFEGKPKRLEIGTAVHGLELTKAAAASLHLAPNPLYPTSNDSSDLTIFKVQSIRIGDLEFQNCDVSVFNNDTIHIVGEDNQDHYLKKLGSLDGMIGADVFKDFLVTLDYPGHILKLDPLPAIPGAATRIPALDTTALSNTLVIQNRFIDPSMKDWAKVYRSKNILIAPVHLNNGPTRLFMLEAGASIDGISPVAAREVAPLSSSTNVLVYNDKGKQEKTYTAGAFDLTFLGLRKQINGMTTFDTSDDSNDVGVEISGFLGLPTLQQLTLRIDYRDMLVNFSYDPKRIVHCSAGIEGPNLPIAGCF